MRRVSFAATRYYKRHLSGFNSKIDRRDVFESLALKNFDEKEIRSSFESFHGVGSQSSSGKNDVTVAEIRARIESIVPIPVDNQSSSLEVQRKFRTEKIDHIIDVISKDPSAKSNSIISPDTVINFESYKSRIQNFGEKIDLSVILPMAASFLLTGASVGIIIPCMPLLVTQLGISPSHFGLIVSSFGLAKLVGNIPAAYYVDTIGRKKMVVVGLSLCSVGIGSICCVSTLASTVSPLLVLMGCRFVTGVGVSALVSGVFMMMTDVSTALNRARTMAPIQSSFQAGVALGPAIGGVAINQVGISNTYLSCGVLFVSIAAINQLFVKETLRPPSVASHSTSNTAATATTITDIAAPTDSKPLPATSVLSSFAIAFKAWKILLQRPEVRKICAINFGYWTAFSGVQMTILPLHMVSDALQLGAFEIGSAFALMSLSSVLASQPAAYMADKKGKFAAIAGGLALMSTSMALIPFATSFEQLLFALMPMSIGSTALSSAPTARMADITDTDRSQALSLLRTVGDVGLLMGAGMAGVLLDTSSVQYAVHANAALTLGLSAFAARQAMKKM